MLAEIGKSELSSYCTGKNIRTIENFLYTLSFNEYASVQFYRQIKD